MFSTGNLILTVMGALGAGATAGAIAASPVTWLAALTVGLTYGATTVSTADHRRRDLAKPQEDKPTSSVQAQKIKSKSAAKKLKALLTNRHSSLGLNGIILALTGILAMATGILPAPIAIAFLGWGFGNVVQAAASARLDKIQGSAKQLKEQGMNTDQEDLFALAMQQNTQALFDRVKNLNLRAARYVSPVSYAIAYGSIASITPGIAGYITMAGAGAGGIAGCIGKSATSNAFFSVTGLGIAGANGVTLVNGNGNIGNVGQVIANPFFALAYAHLVRIIRAENKSNQGQNGPSGNGKTPSRTHKERSNGHSKNDSAVTNRASFSVAPEQPNQEARHRPNLTLRLSPDALARFLITRTARQLT